MLCPLGFPIRLSFPPPSVNPHSSPERGQQSAPQDNLPHPTQLVGATSCSHTILTSLFTFHLVSCNFWFMTVNLTSLWPLQGWGQCLFFVNAGPSTVTGSWWRGREEGRTQGVLVLLPLKSDSLGWMRSERQGTVGSHLLWPSKDESNFLECDSTLWTPNTRRLLLVSTEDMVISSHARLRMAVRLRENRLP